MTNIKKISQASLFIYVLLVFCVYVTVRSTIHIITCTRGNSFGSQMIFRNFNFMGLFKTSSSFKFLQMKGHALFHSEIIVKNTCILTIFFFFSSRTTGPISTKLVQSILVHNPIQGEIIAKIH